MAPEKLNTENTGIPTIAEHVHTLLQSAPPNDARADRPCPLPTRTSDGGSSMSRPTSQGDAHGKLIKLDPSTALPGYSDGLQAAYAYTPEEWREHALRIARHLASTGKPFTVRDFKTYGLQDPETPQQWGSIVAAMRKMQIAHQFGWTGAPLKSGDVSAVRVWQGL